MVLPWRSTVKGLRLRSNRRAAAAPFTVIWNGERMPGTEDGQAPFAGATHRRSVTAGTADLPEAEQPDLAAAASP
jgi:hypothetical protein